MHPILSIFVQRREYFKPINFLFLNKAVLLLKHSIKQYFYDTLLKKHGKRNYH